MTKLKNFLITVTIGGLAVILPIAILLKIFLWLYNWAISLIQPITSLLVETTQASQTLAQWLSFFSVISSCFLVGLLVRTGWGKWLHDGLERLLLTRIPGYKMLKELMAKLQPEQGQKFTQPVLVRLGENTGEFLGFITEEYGDDRFAVFIPTSPSPMNGFVIQTDISRLRYVNVSAETMMKSVIACGVGSTEIINNADASSQSKA
ncbi:DUF502 domain-containing protein [Reinekea marinisedimentorum]|uniref:Putative membrane protein n=1 Tax=Reinekea marinisedimentorum TaxID=230495 RepID=A0A4R3I8D9_9GAMM|nr:DUF502 domain-containing protein [Reinekea marinisedimentorum]TCS42522.1 putative membrane protein [Reinekea marinisedimentorum]